MFTKVETKTQEMEKTNCFALKLNKNHRNQSWTA